MSPGESDWRVRPAETSEYPTLVRIFNQVFKKDKDARTLEWKYLRNPHGKSFVWVAEDGKGELIGSLAFVPRRMCIDGREYPSFLASDGMVYPEWQRRGIFVRLLEIMFENSWASGAPLVYAFSGRRSVKGLIRTHWDEVSAVQELVLPLRGSHLFKSVIRRLPFSRPLVGAAGDLLLRQGRLRTFLNRTPGTDIRVVDRFDDAIAEMGMQALSRHRVYLKKDKDYLNWRYIDNPTGRHRCFAAYQGKDPKGFMVMENAGGLSYIVDLIAVDGEAREDLLAFAVQEGLKGGARMQESMALEGDEVNGLLLSRGFKCRPRYGLLPFMIKMGPSGDDLKPIVTDPGLWYLSHGDKDAEHMTP